MWTASSSRRRRSTAISLSSATSLQLPPFCWVWRSGPLSTSIDIPRIFAGRVFLPSNQPTTSLWSKATSLFALLSFGTRQAEIPDFVLVAAERGVKMPARARPGLERRIAVAANLNVGFSRKLLSKLPPQTANERLRCYSNLNTTRQVGNYVRSANQLVQLSMVAIFRQSLSNSLIRSCVACSDLCIENRCEFSGTSVLATEKLIESPRLSQTAGNGISPYGQCVYEGAIQIDKAEQVIRCFELGKRYTEQVIFIERSIGDTLVRIRNNPVFIWIRARIFALGASELSCVDKAVSLWATEPF